MIFVMHMYIFITVFYFMGVEGFPHGWWLVIEVSSEFIVFIDFFLRIFIRVNYPMIWESMWILHDKG
jgi:hypothetical protein